MEAALASKVHAASSSRELSLPLHLYHPRHHLHWVVIKCHVFEILDLIVGLELPDGFFVNFGGRPIWSGLATVTVRSVAILVGSSLLLPRRWLRHWV